MHEGENISGRRTIGGLHHYSKGFLVMSGRKNHRGWGWIRKRASGRYQASYIGPDHARHYAPTTFHHKVDAEEWLTAEPARSRLQTQQCVAPTSTRDQLACNGSVRRNAKPPFTNRSNQR
jgi:hypothetical protein